MKRLVILFLGTMTLAHGQTPDWHSPVREVPDPTLPDIAFASADSAGFVIYYNPRTAAKVGPLVAAFFRAHEYAHIYLGHVTRLTFARDRYSRLWMSREGEIEADEYATRYFARHDPSVVEATIEWLSEVPNPGDSTHLPGPVRARKIKRLFGQEVGGLRRSASAQTSDPGLAREDVIADRIVEELATGQFEAAVTEFADQLRQSLPAARIGKIWASITGKLGPFERRSPPRRRNKTRLVQIRIGCKFERGLAQVDVNFDGDGRVAGLWIYPGE
jgi:hypothetical protein